MLNINRNYIWLMISVVLLCTTGCTVPTWLQSGLELIIPTIAIGLGGIMTTLFLKVNTWINAKIKIEGVNHAVTIVEEFVESVTQSIITSYRDEILKALADGKFDEEEKKKLRSLAFVIVKERLTMDMMKKIASSLGLSQEAAEKYLTDKITGFLGVKMDGLLSGK